MVCSPEWRWLGQWEVEDGGETPGAGRHGYRIPGAVPNGIQGGWHQEMSVGRGEQTSLGDSGALSVQTPQP